VDQQDRVINGATEAASGAIQSYSWPDNIISKKNETKVVVIIS